MKILILGGTGMLGSMVAKVMPDDWEVLVTARTPAPYPYELVNARWRRFQVGSESWGTDLKELSDGCDWIVNCLGATKPLMQEDAAYTVNAHFPAAVVATSVPVIHASTDCVFDPDFGVDAPTEEDSPDACDLYGRSKAEGDAGGTAESAIILRSSIVGPECRTPARHLLSQVVEERVSIGYADHLWNGVTTLAWARLAAALMRDPGLFEEVRIVHLVPGSSCSKDRLVGTILQAFGMRWYATEAHLTLNPVDMRLSTMHPALRNRLWGAAGYIEPPTIEDLIWELADFCRAEQWPPSGAEGWRYWRR